MGFAHFISSLYGRLLRFVTGVGLIALGLGVIRGIGGVVLAVVGIVPLVASVFNFRGFAPLFGGPFQAKDLQPVPVYVRSEPGISVRSKHIK